MLHYKGVGLLSVLNCTLISPRYVISQTWFDRWNKHVEYDADAPGPIDNSDILQGRVLDLIH